MNRIVQSKRRSAGMTLIELMVVVLIVAILASIAVPGYRKYVMRAQRTDAKTALLRIQAAEEKYYVQYSKYTENIEGQPPAGLGLLNLSETGAYTLDVDPDPTAGLQGWVAKAAVAANGPQKKDTECQSFQIDSYGVRKSSPGEVRTCWR